MTIYMKSGAALALFFVLCGAPAPAFALPAVQKTMWQFLPDSGIIMILARPGGGARAGGGGMRAGGGGGGGANRGIRSGGASSVNHNANVGANRNINANGNRNINANANINRNTNINRNVNVDVHNDYRGGWDDHYHTVATAAAITATAVVTAAVVGSVVNSVPPSCGTVIVNGFSYFQCGGSWYQPRYAGTNVQYVVVNPPQ
jgi:hypothetical protein